MVSQLMLLNKILNTKDFSVVSMNGLNVNHFFNYKAEFNYIRNHLETYKVVPDKLTFASIFPDFDFQDVTEPDSFLVEQVYRDYNQNYLATTFNKMKKALEAGNVEQAQETLKQAFEGQHTGNVMTCTDLITDRSRYDHYLERTIDHDKYYLTTGFPELDRVLGGFDRTEENVVIMARPGIGKSQVLIKLLTTAAKAGLRCGLYEGEMAADKVGYRFDTFLSQIKNSSMNRGDISINQMYKDYIENRLPNLVTGCVKVFTPTDVPNGIVTTDVLKTFIEREQLDILFVDQYDLLDDLGHARQNYEHVANIAKAIKKLQVEKRIPIISVCQMNRTKNEDGSQDTSQAAGSDMISRYATIMIALEQKKLEESVGQPSNTQLTLNIIKARDGGDGNKFVYFVNFNTGEFWYINNENDNITSEEEFNDIQSIYEPNDIEEDSPF